MAFMGEMVEQLEIGQVALFESVSHSLAQLQALQTAVTDKAECRAAENQLMTALFSSSDYPACLAVALKLLQQRPLNAAQFKRLATLPVLSGDFQSYARINAVLQQRAEPVCRPYRSLFALLSRTLFEQSTDPDAEWAPDVSSETNLDVLSHLLNLLRTQRYLRPAANLSRCLMSLLDQSVHQGRQLATEPVLKEAGTSSSVFEQGGMPEKFVAFLVRSGYYEAAADQIQFDTLSIWPVRKRWQLRKALAEELMRASATPAASRMLEAHADDCEQAGLPQPPGLQALKLQIERRAAAGRGKAAGKSIDLPACELFDNGLLEHYRFSDDRCVIWLSSGQQRLEVDNLSKAVGLIPLTFQAAGISLFKVRCRNPYKGILGFDEQLGDRKQAQARLKQLLATCGYRRFAFMGLSLSGSCALIYAVEMAADGVLAFSPQTLNPDASRLSTVHRHLAATIRGPRLQIPNDLEPMLRSSSLATHVYYDQASQFDAEHATRLQGLPNVTLYKELHNTHNVLMAKLIDGSLGGAVQNFASAMRWAAG